MSPTHCNKQVDLQLKAIRRQHMIGRHSPVAHLKSIRKPAASSHGLLSSLDLMRESKADGLDIDRSVAAPKTNKQEDYNNNNVKSVTESSAAAVLLSLQRGQSTDSEIETHDTVAASKTSLSADAGLASDKESQAKQADAEKPRLASLSSEEDSVETGNYPNLLSPCDDEKPAQSYISLIANAILSTAEKRLVLSDIYGYVLQKFPYFRNKGPGWRNSIRHNLSLNECFVKAGRSPNGKGHFWAINPANYDDFSKGDFRRRRAQRRARKAMLLQYTTHHPSLGRPLATALPPSHPLGHSLPACQTTAAQGHAVASFRPIPPQTMLDSAQWYRHHPYGSRLTTPPVLIKPPGRPQFESRPLQAVKQKPDDSSGSSKTSKKTPFDVESLLKKDDCNKHTARSARSSSPAISFNRPVTQSNWMSCDADRAQLTAMHRNSMLVDSRHCLSYCTSSCCCPVPAEGMAIRESNLPYHMRAHGIATPLVKALSSAFPVSPSAESMAQASAIARFERFGLPLGPVGAPFSFYRPRR